MDPKALARRMGHHRSDALDLIRIYLGVALFVRGLLFINEPQLVLEYLNQSGEQWFWPMAITHYVALAHLGGGVMLAIGLFTRFASAMQVPALLGAVLFVHSGEGLLAEGQSLELAALVLFILVLLGAFGAGRLSVDHKLASLGGEGVQPRRPAHF